MQDYAKAQELLVRTGREWNFANPKRTTPRSRIPTTWTPKKNIRSWHRCLAEIGFEVAEDAHIARWIYTHAPTTTRFGVTIIITNDDTPDGRFTCDYTIDTPTNENDSTWETLPERFDTPLEAAQHGMAALRAMLDGASTKLPQISSGV